MVQQLTSYLGQLTDLDDSKCQNYNLNEEIDFCLRCLTANHWEKNCEVYFTRSQLPQFVVGDLTKFRICFRTLLEFTIKYSVNTRLEMRCIFDKFYEEANRRRLIVIKFMIIMKRNPKLDLTPLMLLRQSVEDHNRGASNRVENFNKMIAENYDIFAKHV